MIKCKRSKKLNLILALTVGAFLSYPATSWAASRSANILVSCTVVPAIALTQQNTLSVFSNLGDSYLSSEALIDRGGQKVRLVSITAL